MRETYSLQTPFGREEVDTPLQQTLDKVKLALRVTTDAFDDELKGLIQAAESDLLVAGVALPADVRHADGVSVRLNESPSQRDPLILRAIITYCKLYFGEPEPKRTGFYAKGWKADIEKKASHYVNGTVWNPPDYQIAHLLEDGHGPTEKRPWSVDAKAHIAKVEERAVAQVVKELEAKL